MPKIERSYCVGENLDEAELLDELNERLSDLEDILIHSDLSSYNSRATYTLDSLELEFVEKQDDDGEYYLQYQFGWEAWYGCKDLCDGDIVRDCIDFTYENGKIRFNVTVEAAPKRDTLNEF